LGLTFFLHLWITSVGSNWNICVDVHMEPTPLPASIWAWHPSPSCGRHKCMAPNLGNCS